MKQLKNRPYFIFVILSLLLLFSYINFSALSLSFDEKLRELLFHYRGEIPTTQNVTIIDIDEKSIETLGQWPFSRDTMAQVLINLTNAKAGIIGLDIIFSEADRSSPSLMAQKLNLKGEYQDNDVILGKVIENTPTILGYYFDENRKNMHNQPPLIPTQFEPKTSKWLINPTAVVTNINSIQRSAYSSGFFNAYNNQYGKLTKMPLLLQYNNKIYPSLALEMIRIASQTKTIKLQENKEGLEGLQLNNIAIPTDKNGFLRVNFRGKQKTFKYLSFVDILQGNFKTQDIANKFILIGTSSLTLADYRPTVFDLIMPGVEVHANVIDTILQGDFLYEHNISLLIDVLTILFITLVLSFILLRLHAKWIVPLITFLSISLFYIYYYCLFEKGLVLNLIYPLISIVITTLVALIINYNQEQKTKNIIKDKFAKKVSKEVVNALLENESDAFNSHKKRVTIFFSDIRSFTNLSETIDDPELLIQILNRYMEPMSESIIDSSGTIDKFIGDAIMAYWNAPKEVANHEQKATLCAIEQLQKLQTLNTTLQQEFNLSLEIGIGIHTGEVIIGEMGSQGRSDYTIIGDNVNLASRIEGLTKYFDVPILLTQTTKEALDDSIQCKKLANVKVKGKAKPITIYTPLLKEQSLTEYNEALICYEQQEFEQAKILFESLQQTQPAKINEYYIQACQEHLNNPAKTFDNAFIFDTK